VAWCSVSLTRTFAYATVKNPITISPFYTQASGTLIPQYQEILFEMCTLFHPVNTAHWI